MIAAATAIAEALARIDAPGSFATRLGAPAADLDVRVRGVGRLRLPIAEATADRLRRVARPAPFGLRDRTLFDATVRSTWEIPRRRVAVASRRWNRALAGYLREIQEALGIPADCSLRPVLDKLLLYERGQFFRPHQDSEREDGMVGSLVVVLPSRHTGGALTVEHRGRRKTFRGGGADPRALSLIAFYADCRHEIERVRSGCRVALTYHLRLEAPSRAAPDPAPAGAGAALAGRVREHFATPVARRYSRGEPRPPDRLVYLLDHEYTRRGLSWRGLKRADRPRVAALRAAAERLGCECHLALADVHEVWECEGDDRYDGYRGRRDWRQREEDARDPEDYELLDLQDSTIELRHWLAPDGRSGAGVPGMVGEQELCFTRASVDMDPFRSEHEGWQGNYGNTVDRWYHRAALVLWPRERSFTLRAEADPAWAVRELARVPAGARDALDEKVRALPPEWVDVAGRIDDAGFRARLAEVAGRLSDAERAAALVAPVGAAGLGSRPVRRALARLIDRHGLAWGRTLFQRWMEEWRAPRGVEHLAGTCADLCASGSDACRDLAGWLIEREAARASERAVAAVKAGEEWMGLDRFAGDAERVVHVLAAAAATGSAAVLAGVTDLVAGTRGPAPAPAGTEPAFPLSFRIAVLRKSLARSPALRRAIAGSELFRGVVRDIEAVLAAPPRAPDDWSIGHDLGCPCADCAELGRFLRSGDSERDWPLGKERRRHVHGMIDAEALPVRHTTLRRGSPFVLQLRKDRRLFSREAAYRRRLGAVLKALAAAAR